MARRNTRELVLLTSLALFNKLGEANVSTNLIANEAEISPGNLYYHFRSKEDIVLELFKRYLLVIRPLVSIDEAEQPGIDDLWMRLHLIFEAMGRFRFLFRNLPDLYARLPNLRHALHGLLERQRNSLERLISGLEARGVMSIENHAIPMLVDNMLLNMTYWIPYAEIHGQAGLEDATSITSAAARVLHLILPHMRGEEAQALRHLAMQYQQA